jgi:hypothetical protein
VNSLRKALRDVISESTELISADKGQKLAELVTKETCILLILQYLSVSYLCSGLVD